MTMVLNLSITANTTIADDTAFPWDVATVEDTSYASWDFATDPTKVNIVRTGWYLVGADITTLGTSYGGADNADVIALIGKNGLTLDDTIIAERSDKPNSTGVGLFTVGPQPRYLEAGDYIQLYIQNVNANTTMLESNPSTPPATGSDYTNQPGTGVIGSHLYLIAMGGGAPS